MIGEMLLYLVLFVFPVSLGLALGHISFPSIISSFQSNQMIFRRWKCDMKEIDEKDKEIRIQ